MGVDLAWVPQWINSALAVTRLYLDRDYQLQGAIKKMSPHPLCEPIEWYGDNGVEKRTNDQYGDPLTFVNAGVIQHAWDRGDIEVMDLSDWNRASLAFIRELRPNHRIVLWWH